MRRRTPAAPRSLGVAYVLCVLLGLLGAHRFYLGHPGPGVAYAVLTVVGLTSASWGIGFLFGALVLLLVLIDLFRIPGYVRAANGQYWTD
ncbi:MULTISPECIES: NINE protein [Micrococcaceae]|uniref:NINE protein n=1 Tax=Micrococcaceae TaxID=1268 RepID=UPI001617F985|nr:NINE protein [Citricoccus sp.]MBB5748766.1 TM2 domain-containing membrane protein YozV [Micrococcus sp. TA1]HRO29037.1 NINE protein [Citricoccus sp.]HRO93393.1 NINE protein [Citricoccus sp.]